MHNPDIRILAFAVRARWLGYAIIEGNCTLVDWGMIFFFPAEKAQIRSAKKRVEHRLVHTSPSHIALSLPVAASSRNASGNRSLIRAIRAFASAQSISIRAFSRDRLRYSFRESGASSKDEIAQAIAALFPELKWSVPSKRRIWEKEHFRLTQFDAIAAGVVCWRELTSKERRSSTAP